MGSVCRYEITTEIILQSIVKDPFSNTVILTLEISPTTSSLESLNFSQIITPDSRIQDIGFTYDANGTLVLYLQYNQTIQGENISLVFGLSPTIDFSFLCLPDNNLAATYEDEAIYKQETDIKTVYDVVVAGSYVAMALGIMTDNLIGIELFGVLQLLHISLADINSVPPLLSPTANLSMVHGYNPKITTSHSEIPSRIHLIGYRA